MKKRFFFLLALCLGLLIPVAGAECDHSSTYYESNATDHWQVCPNCQNEITARSAHNFVIEDNMTHTPIRTYTDTCTVCGYVCQHPSTKTVTPSSTTLPGTIENSSYVGCSVCNVRLAAKVAEGQGGGTYYTRFSDALTAANKSESETVILTLLNPLLETNVTISRDMTLDLGGCDWDASSNPDKSSPVLTVEENVTLTLCNNKPSSGGTLTPSIPGIISPASLSGTSSGGTITPPENAQCLYIKAGGTLRATNVTLQGAVRNEGTIAKEGSSSGGTFTGTVENGNYDSRATISGGTFHNTVNNNRGTISGGTFTATSTVNCGSEFSYGNITGGTFHGTVKNNDGTISGGTFSGTVNNNATNLAQGHITGGTFTGTVNNAARNSNSSILLSICGIVSGGDFSGAKKVENIAKITFDLRGAPGSVATQWRYGAAITKPVNPTYAGRAFRGWYNGGTEGDFSTDVYSDLNLTAKWDCATFHGYVSGDECCPDCGKALYATRYIAASKATVGYKIINLALTDAQPEDTVTLLQSATCGTINTLFASCTLDLGGYELCFPQISSLAANNSPLTITDSSAGKTGKIAGTLRIWSTAKVSLTGGYYNEIVALDDHETLADLLAPGYGFLRDSTWLDGNTKSLSNVRVALLPIQSVTVTPSTATVTYGQTSNLPTFTATATLSEDFSTASRTYQWLVDDVAQKGATDATFTLPASLTGGSHTVTCRVSCDGTSRTSEPVTVTVQPKPISITGLTPQDRAYEPGNCVVDVKVDFSDNVTLTLGTDYTATGTVADDNAGVGKVVSNVTVKLLGNAAKNYNLNDDISQLVWLSDVGITPIAHPDETVSTTAKYGARSSFNLRPYSFDGNVTLKTVADGDGILATPPSLEGTTLQFQFIDDPEIVGKTATLTLEVADCTNYTKYNITLTLTASATDPGAAPSRYAITLAETVHGTVTASTKKAQSGQTVTLTIAPDEGYELERLTVLTAKGREAELTEAGEGTFTFVMPRGAVTVEAVFSSTRPCTRAELVTSLHGAVGDPEPTGVAPFDDVPPTADYAKAVAWAFENDLVKGCGNNLFYPDNAISREEIATILYRYIQSQGSGFTGSWAFRLPFEDIEEISDWAWEAVCWCYKEGILEGFENQLAPKGECSRAQIIAMLYQLLAR